MNNKAQVEYGSIVTSDTSASGTILINEFCLRLFMQNLEMRKGWHWTQQIETPDWYLMPHIQLNKNKEL